MFQSVESLLNFQSNTSAKYLVITEQSLFQWDLFYLTLSEKHKNFKIEV